MMFSKTKVLFFILSAFYLFSFNDSSLASDRNFDPQDPIKVKAQRLNSQPIKDIFKLRCYDLYEVVINPSILSSDQRDRFISANLTTIKNNPLFDSKERDEIIRELFLDECVRRDYIPALHEKIANQRPTILKMLRTKYTDIGAKKYQDFNEVLTFIRTTSNMNESETRAMQIIWPLFNQMFFAFPNLDHEPVHYLQRPGATHCCWCDMSGLKLGLSGLKPYHPFAENRTLTDNEIDVLLNHWRENLQAAVNLYKIKEGKPATFLEVYPFAPFWFDQLCKIGAGAKSQTKEGKQYPPEAPLISINHFLIGLDGPDIKSFAEDTRPWWRDISWKK